MQTKLALHSTKALKGKYLPIFEIFDKKIIKIERKQQLSVRLKMLVCLKQLLNNI